MACSSWYVLANVPQYSLRTNHAVRTTDLPAPNYTRQSSQIPLQHSLERPMRASYQHPWANAVTVAQQSS